jgi:GNAT superfamily N-acetyltransferase
MPPATPTAPPFGAERWQLALRGGNVAWLEPLDLAASRRLAEAVAAIDPWARLGTGSERMLTGLTVEDPHVCRRRIVVDGEDAGLVVVRYPWLFGPYLNLLAVLPAYQRGGLGAAVIAWMEAEVAGYSRNLWLCASSFNAAALAFYAAQGFARVGDLPDLVAPGFAEVLMRKRLDAPAGSAR